MSAHSKRPVSLAPLQQSHLPPSGSRWLLFSTLRFGNIATITATCFTAG